VSQCRGRRGGGSVPQTLAPKNHTRATHRFQGPAPDPMSQNLQGRTLGFLCPGVREQSWEGIYLENSFLIKDKGEQVPCGRNPFPSQLSNKSHLPWWRKENKRKE